MFDIQKILTRSWHVLWNYKMLWVFGFILALALGGNNFGSQSSYRMNDGDRNPPAGSQSSNDWDDLQGDTFAEKMNDAFGRMQEGFARAQAENPVEFRMGFAAIITFFVVVLILSILTTILRYVAETASIRMVDEYEQSGVKVGFRQGWRYGWSPAAWRVFLADFLVHLPGLILFVVLGLIGWWVFSAFMGGVESTIISTLIAGVGLAFLFIFTTAILMAVLIVVRDLAWRRIVLGGAGVREALGNALGLIRRQWKSVGLMWLVMFGLKIAWGIVFFILVFPLLIVSIITALGGVAVALVPTLITAGIASLLSAPEYWPWIFAAIIGLPLFIVVTFSPILLVGGWAQIYQSSVWTLTYRELNALEAVATE